MPFKRDTKILVSLFIYRFVDGIPLIRIAIDIYALLL
jgi:hypothetical protein